MLKMSFVKGVLEASLESEFAIDKASIDTMIHERGGAGFWTLKTKNGSEYRLTQDSGWRIYNTLNSPN